MIRLVLGWLLSCIAVVLVHHWLRKRRPARPVEWTQTDKEILAHQLSWTTRGRP